VTGRRIPLSALLEGAGIPALEFSGGDPEIRRVHLDSRKIREGDLFCAIRGFRSDGESFSPDAVRRGAAAVLSGSPRPEWLDSHIAWVRVDNPRMAVGPVARECYGRPDETLILVGITGTNGKTTVVYMVDAIARAAGCRTGRIGTVGYAYGDTELPSARTTPEAPDLFAMLAGMRDAETDLVVMEVSSHALDLGRIRGAQFAVAAFLNLGKDHLEYHGDRDSYFRAKALLFRSLDSDRYAVLPADDPLGREIAGMCRARPLTFGRSEHADVRITEERHSATGSGAVLVTESRRIPVHTRIPGAFNLDNAAAAVACALAANLPPEAATRGIESLETVPGRMETVDRGQPFTVLVDYAHTEEALACVLQAARGMTGNKVLVVFGCGGERDRGKRRPMGATAAAHADGLFLTSDNPRGEDPEAILDDIEAGVRSVSGGAARMRRIPDRAEAIAGALSEATDGDVVVIAGKGHETTQDFGDRSEPLDDRRIAAHVLERQGYTGVAGAGT
jgi:UDP-N-acetylmuramoyl-L-alanyl-D-glutamate--2,6-diaminopimelate ligase